MSGTGPAPTAPPTPPTNTTSPPPSASSPPPAASPPPSPPVQAPPPATTPPPPATTVSPPPPSTPPPTSTPAPPPPVTPTTPPPSGSPPSPPSTTPSPPPSRTPPPSPPTGGNSPPSPPVGGNSPPLPPTSGNSPPAPSGTGRPLAPPPPPPESSSSELSKGVVVGIAIGGVVILVVLVLLFICFRKKKRKNHGRIDYYPPPPPLRVKADPYGGNVQHWQHNAPPPGDHVISIPPKLSHPPGGAASRPPHPPARAPSPQLPPSYMSSSGANSSSYSGSENPLPPPSPDMALGSFSKSTFTYDELLLATGGFTDANLLGQGGFGYVHKGILPTGKVVAVKQLKAGSRQGEREFQAEVDIISRVHHKHLVSLVGYCITGAQRMLVYEFVPNNTLEFHLHANGRPPLDWPTRLKIALGSAKGLAYLHEDCQPKIIHRDIKAANILLDFNFETKVADFGLAKITSDINTHVSTRVMGTFGYLAPEYASSGKLSEKSDVYSFGVMLLELITGRRPVDSTHSFNDDSFVDWARPLLTRALDDEKFDTLVDPRLENEYSHKEMTRMVACAAACVRHSARRRPRMSQVVRALEGDVSLSDLNEGIRPGHSTVYSSYGSSDYDASQYNEDKKNYWKMMELTNEEISSSDQYNNPTSEHGSNPSGSSSEGQQSREMETNNQTKKDSGGIGESKGFTGIS